MKIDCLELNSEKLTPYCRIQIIQKRHSKFMSALSSVLDDIKLTPYSERFISATKRSLFSFEPLI